MKKRIALFLALMACIITGAMAQNMACLGLKNPTNFTLTGGEGRTQWTGYIGSKAAQASTCNNIPLFNGSTTVAANQLATQVTTVTSSCRGGSSRNYANQPDNSNRFVIKGRGFALETQNRLTYTPAVYTNGTSYTLDSSYTSSIRLGNYCGYGEAEALTYQLYVTPNNALVTLWFAMSLENGQHNEAQTPSSQSSSRNRTEAAGHTSEETRSATCSPPPSEQPLTTSALTADTTSTSPPQAPTPPQEPPMA